MRGPKAVPLPPYRVLDLTDGKGHYCTKLLADLGADVVVVEPPGGSPTRRIPPFKGNAPHQERSLYFAYYNTNKRSVTLDLTSGDGRELFLKLAKGADVLVETFPPGFLKEIGLDYPKLKEAKPSLILCSITPFGQSGPYRDYKGPDIVGFAMGGAMYVSGEADGPPCVAPGELAYGVASTYAAMGILIALYHRSLTGQGQQIDVSVQEAVAMITDSTLTRLSYEGYAMPRQGNTYLWITPGNLYRCKDGYVRIVGGQPIHWRMVLDWMGGPEVLREPLWLDRNNRNQSREFIDSSIEEFTRDRTREELFRDGQRHRVPVTPLYNPGEFVESDLAEARGFFVEVDHPEIGSASYPLPPYKLSETPLGIGRPAPLLGEHNEEVYCGELGLSREDLMVLRQAGVI